MDAWLSVAEFKGRTVIPAVNIDAVMRFRYRKEFDDASADAQSIKVFGEVVLTGDVVTVILTSEEDVTADLANFATITVQKRTDGGAPTAIATISTDTNSFSAGVPIALSISSAPVSAGDTLTVSIEKTGTGVVLPALSIDVKPDRTFVDTHLLQVQARITAQLRKRYKTPFAQPFPEILKHWLVNVATPEIWPKIGWNPGSEQDREIAQAKTDALVEIKEAADAKEGLYDLPLNDDEDPNVSGVTEGFPLSYSEQSPYKAFDDQVVNARREDGSGR